MTFYQYTNKGPRKINEDSYWVKNDEKIIYACVADGVGGFSFGEWASNFVVEKFKTFTGTQNASNNLEGFLTKANEDLIIEAQKELNVSKIGTTFTSATITSKKLKGIHIGDSRICILRGNGIKQITEEHNEAGRLIREGKLSPFNKKNYPRRNVIEHVMGIRDLFKFQVVEFDLKPKDRIILSTDGFHETLPKKEIRDISIRHEYLEGFHRQLIIEIENRILRDNVTFLCIEIS